MASAILSYSFSIKSISGTVEGQGMTNDLMYILTKVGTANTTRGSIQKASTLLSSMDPILISQVQSP